jgi:hypothetical protein
MLLAMGTRLAGRVPQHTINTVTTNVPGPQFPLYMLGHQMIEAYPVRADLWERANQHRDLQLPGRAQLWGDCGLRFDAGY